MEELRISYIKSKSDLTSFRIPRLIGSNIVDLEDNDRIDEEISKLVKQNYDTIIISNEVAGFSESIIKEYENKKNISIIIAP